MRHCCSVTPRLRKPGTKEAHNRLPSPQQRHRKRLRERAHRQRLPRDRAVRRKDRQPTSSTTVLRRTPTRDTSTSTTSPATQIARRIETRARTTRCAAENHIARLERAESRQVADQVRDREQHPIAGVVLALFPIHARRDAQGRRTTSSAVTMYGTDSPGAIEILTLRHIEFRVTQPIANRPLVTTGVAEHVR
jgi:hypothetical protein